MKKRVKHFIHYLRSKYIFRFWILFAPLFLITILSFSFISYQMSSSVIIQDYIDNKEQFNTQISSNLTDNINTLSQYSLSSLLLQDDINYVINHNYSDSEYFDKFLSLNTYFFSLLQNTPKVTAVTICDTDGTIVLYKNAANGTNSQNFLGDEDWFHETISLNGRPCFIPPHTKDYLFSNESFISVGRALKASDNSVSGVILFDQPEEEFLKDMKNASLKENESLSLFTSDGDLIYSNLELASDVTEYIQDKIAGGQTGIWDYHSNGEKLMIILSRMDYDLTVASVIPYSTLNQQSNFIWQINFVLSLIVLLTAFFLFVIVSHFLDKPIQKLHTAIKEVKGGDFSTQVNIPGTHEIAQIGNAFNDMVININELIQQKYEMNLLRKQAELTLLQNQINPHFLYNTLASIMNVSERGEREKTSLMIQNLSDIFRYNLSKGDPIVKLQDELQQIRRYLELQEARYAGRYQVIYDVSPEVLQCRIPRFTLQPVVENAIYHGLEQISKPGEIVITARKFENVLNIYISDNGNGIPPSQLSEMNALLSDWNDTTSTVESARVGIYNVNARIKLYFGREYGIKITSRAGNGTTVKLTVPA